MGTGADIWDGWDQFRFAYQPVTGDAVIFARVQSLQQTDPWAKAGVMIRSGLDGQASHAFMTATAANGRFFQRRPVSGAGSSQSAGCACAPPGWVRLVRQGNVFSAFESSDGGQWTLVGTETIAMPATVYVGLAVTSHNPYSAAAATFTNVSLTGATPPTPTPTPTPSPSPSPSGLPSPWAAGDVGGPSLAGLAAESAGTFTVQGAGVDIWGSTDQFHFVYQPVAGNTVVVARVQNLQQADPWSKAGVMIRASLSGSSTHAFMAVAGSNGRSFQRRPITGAESYFTPGCACGAPGWVRLAREGNLFSAYESSNGYQWTLVGTETIAMPATVYVGLAVTSHNPAAKATASFTNVSIGTPNNSNPTVSILAPAAGATFAAPANIVVTASATDVDGQVVKVDFRQGAQLIGSSTTAPFWINWSNVAAGSYSLTAVATDNQGGTTTSAAVPITVTGGATAPAPATLKFVPSPHHDTGVSSYTLQLRRSIDAPTAAPMASAELGKPYISNGEIAVDVTAMVNALPAGTYYAVVVTNGPGGSTPSVPSLPFLQ